ncbi:MAG: MFS transporter [Thermoplasmata archaeon]
MVQTQIAEQYGAGGAGFAALALSLLGLSATLPTLGAAVISGTLADRYDRRRLLKLSGVIALGAAVALAAVLAFDPRASFALPAGGAAGFVLPLWLVLTLPIWAALTTAVTLFRPTFNAALPQLVPARDLGSANGLMFACAVALSSSTQILTGFLAQRMGPVIALFVPIVLFAGSLVFLLLLGEGARGNRAPRPQSFLADAQEGYRYLVRRRELLAVTVAALGINFLSALAFVELAEYSSFFLKETPSFLGLLYGLGTLGAGAGALAVTHLKYERHLGRLLGAMTLGMGACVAGLALTRSAAVALADMFLFGMFPGMFQTAFQTGVQATVPNELLGRVFAADEVGSYAFVPVGQYAGGLSTYSFGIPPTYLGAGLGMGIIGVGLLTLPVVGRFRFDPDPTASMPPPGALLEAPLLGPLLEEGP